MKKLIKTLPIVYATVSLIYIIQNLISTYVFQHTFNYYGYHTGIMIWILVLALLAWYLIIKQSKAVSSNPQDFNLPLMITLYTIVFVDSLLNAFLYHEFNNQYSMIPMIPGLITCCLIFTVWTYNKKVVSG